MATSVDVAPTIGHAALMTQGGVGSTPGYDAIDVRRLAQVGLQEGVHDSVSWKVSEHSPRSMIVDVAANNGVVTVQGDSVSNQGMYVVSPHSSVANITLTSAHASLPRLDQIVVRVYDDNHDGSGQNKATIELLTGTPTTGATLSNRNGAAALPAGAIRLADIVVAANATTIANSVIRDRRRWSFGAYWQGSRQDDITRYSTSWTEVDASALQARLECTGVPVLINFTGNGDGSSNGQSDLHTGVWIDGNLVDSQYFGIVGGNVSNRPCGYTMITVPSVGSHLFTAVMNSTGGDGVTIRGWSHFSIQELVLPNANNGVT